MFCWLHSPTSALVSSSCSGLSILSRHSPFAMSTLTEVSVSRRTHWRDLAVPSPVRCSPPLLARYEAGVVARVCTEADCGASSEDALLLQSSSLSPRTSNKQCRSSFGFRLLAQGAYTCGQSLPHCWLLVFEQLHWCDNDVVISSVFQDGSMTEDAQAIRRHARSKSLQLPSRVRGWAGDAKTRHFQALYSVLVKYKWCHQRSFSHCICSCDTEVDGGDFVGLLFAHLVFSGAQACLTWARRCFGRL